MSKIYFLDFEASSLSAASHPIEIAWVGQDGQGESWLIRPAPGWTDWSAASETVHGISRSELEAQGSPFEAVARRAAQVLAPDRALVFADQPAFDGEWLRMLLKAAGVPTILGLDVVQLYGQACRPLLGQCADRENVSFMARQIVAEAENAEAARHRQRHRALPDAEGLWWIWRDIQRRVAVCTAERKSATGAAA